MECSESGNTGSEGYLSAMLVNIRRVHNIMLQNIISQRINVAVDTLFLIV